MFTFPSGPSGRPSFEMFFHCAPRGIEARTRAMASAAARVFMAAESIRRGRCRGLTYLGDWVSALANVVEPDDACWIRRRRLQRERRVYANRQHFLAAPECDRIHEQVEFV